MSKLSKYTFFTVNRNNELLLYNTLKGIDSFCKLDQCDYNKKVLETKNIEDINADVIPELLQKGIIIEDDVDERKRLLVEIMKTVNPQGLTLFINSTEHCNFRCKYCYESHSKGEMSEAVQDEIIKFVRENIRFYPSLHVEWFGGEPLLGLNCIERLSKEFAKICAYYKRRYTASMTTNGYLLTSELLCKLVKLNVRRFQITVDGIKSDHDDFRVLVNGAGTFDQIVKNLMDIKSLKRNDFSILLRTNVSMKNFENIDEYLCLLEKLTKNDDRMNVGIFKVGNWLDKANEGILGDIIDDSADMRRIYEAILTSNYQINMSSIFLNPGSGVCYGGKANNFLVCSDGSLHKCTVTFEEPDSIVGELKDGEISLNEKYYAMISDYSKCDRIFECDSAPVCMGEPCPVTDRTGQKGRHCSYYKDCLDLILLIFDKNGKFPKVGK